MHILFPFVRYSFCLKLLFQDNIRPDIVKSAAGYRTGHFPEIRPDTGPDLLSGTPLELVEDEDVVTSCISYLATQSSFEVL